jgi:hypothetical protein
MLMVSNIYEYAGNTELYTSNSKTIDGMAHRENCFQKDKSLSISPNKIVLVYFFIFTKPINFSGRPDHVSQRSKY